MRLLVGLGNPGEEYAGTRHNVGFMAVDEIVHRYSFSDFRDKFKGSLAVGTIEGVEVLALKPKTYMNLSGESVAAVASFYKIKPEDIVVFHDDMDLPIGKVKVKTGGSPGGHNGLKSLDGHLGRNYVRVRVGIDHPENRDAVVHWVLSRFSVTDRDVITDVLKNVALYLPLLLQGQDQTFMNRLIGQ